ncbi:MAG: PQQ-binding-like beta-propeller repeat protein [Candidatus Poribacteria bacterium]|nr:PQQ-binding-like beta-propeller repeat protein [Candidatus Poribacteria bacterium]
MRTLARVTLFLLSLPLTLLADAQASDWNDFLGPQRNGKSEAKIDIAPWGKTGPPIVWHQRIGTSYGAPTVANGRLFIFARHGDMARLTCMESDTGTEFWRFEYPTDYEDMYGYNNGPRSCPVVDGERVYIFGADGMLHCVRVSDGKALWEVDTMAKFHVVQNFFGVASAPAIEGELLIVQIGGSPPGSPKDIWGANGSPDPNGSGIVAFNKHTGEVIYQIADDLASYASPVFTTIDDRRWGFAFLRSGLVGFEPTSGVIDFHYPWRHAKIESVNASSPVVADDFVFISESYGIGSSVLKVHPSGYEVVWKDRASRRNKSMELHWNTAIHHAGYLYACSGQRPNGAELRCVELKTGKVMWSQRVDERASLLWVNDYFIYLGEYGRLMLLKCTPEKLGVISQIPLLKDKNGRQLVKYPAWAAPVLAEGYLYVRGKDRLICFDLRSSTK